MRNDGARPRYQRLAQQLRDEIESGRYPLGSLLPTEFEIGAQFRVSRATVREAIRQLQVDGLVSRRAGIGTRVEASRPISRYTQSGSSIEELISDASRIRVLAKTFDDVVAHGELARQLRSKTGQGFLRVRGLVVPVEHNDARAPYYWVELHIRSEFADIRDKLKNYKGLVAELIEQRFGERITEIRQAVGAVLVDPAIAKQLKVPAGSPALHFQRWYHGNGPTPLLVSSSIRPADRFTYETRIIRHQTI